MTLNSLDIQNKVFNPQFRGYKKQEVDEFLDIVSKDYDEMSQKIKDQEKDIKTMTERLRDFDNMKDSLNRSILVAQETADNVKAQAEANAERINQEASQRSEQILGATHREARQILQSTYDEARRLVNESDELKRGMRSYYQRVTMLIEGQLASVKSSEWEETLRPSPVYVGDTEEKLREIIEHTNQNFAPINEKGEEIEREGKTAPETLESFENALRSQGEESEASDSTSEAPVVSETSSEVEEISTTAEDSSESPLENGEKPLEESSSEKTVDLGSNIHFN